MQKQLPCKDVVDRQKMHHLQPPPYTPVFNVGMYVCCPCALPAEDAKTILRSGVEGGEFLKMPPCAHQIERKICLPLGALDLEHTAAAPSFTELLLAHAALVENKKCISCAGPVQCPYNARTVPVQCPSSFSC